MSSSISEPFVFLSTPRANGTSLHASTKHVNRQLGQWAEDAEQRVAKEQDNTRLTREWAERTVTLLLTEREESKKPRQWIESAEQRFTLQVVQKRDGVA